MTIEYTPWEKHLTKERYEKELAARQGQGLGSGATAHERTYEEQLAHLNRLYPKGCPPEDSQDYKKMLAASVAVNQLLPRFQADFNMVWDCTDGSKVIVNEVDEDYNAIDITVDFCCAFHQSIWMLCLPYLFHHYKEKYDREYRFEVTKPQQIRLSWPEQRLDPDLERALSQ